MRGMGCATVAALFLAAPVAAQNPQDDATAPQPDAAYAASMAEAAWDWQPGDLIFRNGVNAIDDAMRRSFGLKWASVGILRPSSGGPRVAFVDQSDGVTEVMLYEHIEGLSPDEYAVYRLRDLTPDDRPDAQMWPGPMVRFALFITYGQPFDTEFMLGDGKFYNAELAYQSALNAGIVPGKPLRLRDLIDAPGDMDPAFRKLLGGHRYCRYEPTFDDCWTYNLRDQAIVTTDSLIASGALEQVFP